MKKLGIFVTVAIIVIFFLLFFASQSTPKANSPFVTPSPNLTDIPANFIPLQRQQSREQQEQETQQAQQQNDQQALQAELERVKAASITATIKTTKGDIVMQLDGRTAPITVYNFTEKAKAGFYKNLTFHRVEDWVIQGGDPKGDGTGGSNIPSELTQNSFVPGAVGMARRGDPKVQNDSQFFIVKTDASWLNGQYTLFGTVVEGMDTVGKITKGDKIQSISIIDKSL